ncbi:MAG TPA: hypothetical protein PKL31_14500 [Fulvivirga sp.]|nr:hypothetical protein [Fulvivirga sp.]
MKNIIISTILFAFMALSGCDLLNGNGENFPPEPDIEHYTIIENNSSHTINIQSFYKEDIFHSITLKHNETWKIYNEIFKENIPYLPSGADSSYVIYDGSITVVHTKEEQQDVSRSLWLRSSYTGGKVNDKLYEIYYTFTDADYEEAVALNGGG